LSNLGQFTIKGVES
jgi:hypothetical protein